MNKLGKIAKAIMAFLATGSATALGFLPHDDQWFNILTAVVGVAGVYGVYAVPNKVLASDVIGILQKFLPPAVVVQIAPLIGSLANDLPVTAVPPFVPSPSPAPALTPIPAVVPPIPAGVTAPGTPAENAAATPAAD